MIQIRIQNTWTLASVRHTTHWAFTSTHSYSGSRSHTRSRTHTLNTVAVSSYEIRSKLVVHLHIVFVYIHKYDYSLIKCTCSFIIITLSHNRGSFRGPSQTGGGRGHSWAGWEGRDNLICWDETGGDKLLLLLLGKVGLPDSKIWIWVIFERLTVTDLDTSESNGATLSQKF